MKVYVVYAFLVLSFIYVKSSNGSIIIDWSAVVDALGDGDGGHYHSYGGGGYHK